MENYNNFKVAAFGEILFDIIDGEERIGGAPLNFAANIAELGADIEILSALGCDKRAQAALEKLFCYGVGSEFVMKLKDYPTGIVEVKVCPNGQPTYDIIESVAYDYINYNKKLIDSIASKKWDAFYFGTLAQRNKTSRESLYSLLENISVETVFCDINLRQKYFSKDIVKKSLNYADIVKINDDEHRQLSLLLYNCEISQQDLYHNLKKDFGVELLLVTCGKDGCNIFDKSGWFHNETVDVEVVDTIGAGDAFSAAFLYNFLKGEDLTQCANEANKLGAYIASQSNSVPTCGIEVA